MNKIKFILPLFVFLSACKSVYVPGKLEYEGYRITKDLPRDSSLIRMTQPYRDSLDKSMNEVLGRVEGSLEKRQPSGSLNNFMADAMLYMARQKINPATDVAMVNYGGVRIPQLPAGNITRGKVFELMPFDNVLIVQELKGSVLQNLLDQIAERGGWPIAGATMHIRNKKAVDVMIGGKPLNPSQMYLVANSDYVANGGDDANMLKSIPQQNKGYLMRDAIMDYIAAMKAQGKNIPVNEEKRITNE